MKDVFAQWVWSVFTVFGFIWARIFKLLRNQRIDSKEPIPSGYVAWRADTTTKFAIPTGPPIDCSKNSSTESAECLAYTEHALTNAYLTLYYVCEEPSWLFNDKNIVYILIFWYCPVGGLFDYASVHPLYKKSYGLRAPRTCTRSKYIPS
jgi:hypothetical protein